MSVRNIWVSLVNQVYGLLGLAHGGTNVDLSATGGTSQVLKQVTAGAAITVGQLAAADLSNGTTGSGNVVLAQSPLYTPVIDGGVGLTIRKHSATQTGNLLEIQAEESTALLAITGGGRLSGTTGQGALYIQPGAPGISVLVTGMSGQTASIFEVTDNSNNPYLTVGATGAVNATVGYQANGTPGVGVGPGAPTSITTIGGIVTALTIASDERLKDYKPYKGGLDEILAINPIRYKWNELGKEVAQRPADDDREYVGFGAQDIQKAIPEAIVGQQIAPDGTEYLGFDDRPIIAALVNAVKTLEARVRELEAHHVNT